MLAEMAEFRVGDDCVHVGNSSMLKLAEIRRNNAVTRVLAGS